MFWLKKIFFSIEQSKDILELGQDEGNFQRQNITVQ
jgi:hypothetical protein